MKATAAHPDYRPSKITCACGMVYDTFSDARGLPDRRLLELPPVLHRQAEAARQRRPGGALQQEVRPHRQRRRNHGRAGLESAELAAAKRADVGGQAVIEGVMMRSPSSFTVVCRRPDGSVVIKEEAWRPLWSNIRFLRAPFLRGAVVLLESLVNGISALTFSATSRSSRRRSRRSRSCARWARVRRMTRATARTWRPGGWWRSASSSDWRCSSGRRTWRPGGWARWFGFDTSSFVFHAVDGVIKLALLVGYMATISLLPDVKRVFQYHGAEHRAIFTYERGLPLTVENARAQSRFHPRCGDLVPPDRHHGVGRAVQCGADLPLAESAVLDHLLKIAIKVPLMFPIAGLAYELIKLSGRRCDTRPDRGARCRRRACGCRRSPRASRTMGSSRSRSCRSARRCGVSGWGRTRRDRPRGIEVYQSGSEVDLPLIAA